MFLKPLENTGSFKNPAAQTERRSFGAVNIGIFEQPGACQNGQKSSLESLKERTAENAKNAEKGRDLVSAVPALSAVWSLL